VTGIGEVLFQPPFEKSSSETTRGREARDDAAAVKTYRYLRLGMVMVVIALAASVVIEVKNSQWCWKGSISAYYYSPARPVLVSGLVVIGVSLIIIKGSTVVEDILLNVAGMLAPIVAFVPTNFDNACVPADAQQQGGQLPADIVRDVQNNLAALFFAGSVALAVAVVVFVIDQLRGTDGLATGYVKSRILGLALGALALVLGVSLLATDKILELHGKAAMVMFGFLGVASIWNGAWLYWTNRNAETPTSRYWKAFAVLYIAVGLAMGLAALIIMLIPDPWEQRTLVLEFTEVGLFAAMWTVQSVERWGKVLQTPVSELGG
jgi:hypothetical protein